MTTTLMNTRREAAAAFDRLYTGPSAIMSRSTAAQKLAAMLGLPAVDFKTMSAADAKQVPAACNAIRFSWMVSQRAR